jgi:hypothetical protein
MPIKWQIWLHFKNTDDHWGFAICNYCDIRITSHKSGTTTSVWDHFNNFHATRVRAADASSNTENQIQVCFILLLDYIDKSISYNVGLVS